MKKVITILGSIMIVSIVLISCYGTPKDKNVETKIDDTLKDRIDTIKVNDNGKIVAEKKLNVSFKTKLVEWGGDGKWHDMFKNDNGSYWVNYSDPFKIILTGYYTDLKIKIKSSNGSTIFDKSGVEVPINGEYIISNDKMIGEYETSFNIEIKENEKILFNGEIESMPGG
jgi:archaellum component FlaF (FlaF/FlaG flagellin family)